MGVHNMMGAYVVECVFKWKLVSHCVSSPASVGTYFPLNGGIVMSEERNELPQESTGLLKTPVGRLRVISMLEGISYLLLVFVGMPLKYSSLAMPMPNKVLGMGHGLLTMVFFFILVSVYGDRKISLSLAIKTFVASLIPFGAFFIERKLKEVPQE